MASPKITLHWLNESRSQRIAWLLEELNLPYDLKIYFRDAQSFAPPELEKVNPLGKSPALEVDGKILTESGYIMEYIMRKFGQGSDLDPKNDEDRERVEYFLHYCEGSFQPFLVMLLLSQKVRELKLNFLIKAVATRLVDRMDAGYAGPNTKKNLDFLESELSKNGSTFFVGNSLTAADIMLSFPLQNSKRFQDFTESKYPHISAFLQSIKERPAYKKAAEKTKERSEIARDGAKRDSNLS